MASHVLETAYRLAGVALPDDPDHGRQSFRDMRTCPSETFGWGDSNDFAPPTP